MKKFLIMTSLLILFGTTLYYRDNIIDTILDNFNDIRRDKIVLNNNNYALNNNFKFIQLTDNFDVKSKQDILNVYYTVLNSGMKDFDFYCDKEYINCLEDVNYISNNQKLLSHINNYVPVYNSFKNIETQFDNLGKVHIYITHSYEDPDIVNKIEEKINSFLKEHININQSDDEKIKLIHDYIINNAKYDSNRSDNKVITYHSDIAYGPLVEGYAICGGYADAMKLFLDKLNIPNYKISSENHVWNVLYLKDHWYHLDLTWDDPVTSSGEDILEYDYFLISTDDLAKLEKEQHNFDKTIYLELNEKSA